MCTSITTDPPSLLKKPQCRPGRWVSTPPWGPLIWAIRALASSSLLTQPRPLAPSRSLSTARAASRGIDFRVWVSTNGEKTLDLTLASPVFLTQAFASALAGDSEGAVVNVTDAKTATPYREHFSYVVAKGGLDVFTRAAALALAPRIRVNAVALGVVLPPPGEDDEHARRLASKVPMRRPGGAEPVASAVLALIENDFVTGEIIRVDGGGHLV